MASWTDDELATLHATESLNLAAAPADTPATGRVEIGVVTVGDAAYVRAYRGTRSTWFQATQAFRHGRIWAGPLESDVSFQAADPSLRDEIDAAYHSKYGHYGATAVGLAVSAASRAATVKIMPTGR
jgi:hypothetical protein